MANTMAMGKQSMGNGKWAMGMGMGQHNGKAYTMGNQWAMGKHNGKHNGKAITMAINGKHYAWMAIERGSAWRVVECKSAVTRRGYR